MKGRPVRPARATAAGPAPGGFRAGGGCRAGDERRHNGEFQDNREKEHE